MAAIRDRRLRHMLVLLVAAAFAPHLAWGQSPGLRVGAARVNITPAGIPPASVRDSLYVRAIVIDNGVTRAALISADQAGSDETLWTSASQEIASELDTPPENILLSVTHTHSAGGASSFMRSPLLPAALNEVVALAKSRLSPAVMGYGEGRAYLNVNRDAIHPTTRLWYQGPNLDGVSDKTVPVISFWTPEGAPIAAYYSYAMHPVNFYQSGYVSADFSGEAARMVEQVLGSDFVTLFVQAPSGDQNPLSGRTRLDSGRQGMVGQFADGPDVNIRVGMLRIGSVALATINAEVYTEIGLRMRAESPLANLMPISLTNGSARSGYIPNDASFSHNTFQVLGSRLSPGCAENAIVNATAELVAQTMN